MRKILISLMVVWAQASPAPDSTGAGSGGDVMERLLVASRQSLISVYESLLTGVHDEALCRCPENTPDPFCQSLRALSAEQAEVCRTFLVTTRLEARWFARSTVGVPFRIVYAPLLVTDPFGQVRPVRALTPLGPAGSVDFHYGGTSSLWPSALVALMAHELGHKTAFGSGYVDDNPPIGAFAFAGGGRALLDAVGSAVARHALRGNLVPQYQGIEDLFTCSLMVGGQSFTSTGRSPRMYRDAGLRAYDTGVGNLPRDFSCRIDEGGGRSYLTSRLWVHDDADCAPLGQGGERWSVAELWRVHVGRSDEKIPPPEKLGGRIFAGWSPVCDPHSQEKLVLAHGSGTSETVFRIRHVGTARYDSHAGR